MATHMVYWDYCVRATPRLLWGTYRPLDGQGCQSHWMCGGGTPWDVQWSACLLPCGTKPGSCEDTAFSPIWGLTVTEHAHTNITNTHSYHSFITSRIELTDDFWVENVSHRLPRVWAWDSGEVRIPGFAPGQCTFRHPPLLHPLLPGNSHRCGIWSTALLPPCHPSACYKR